MADELFRQKPVSLNLHNTSDQILKNWPHFKPVSMETRNSYWLFFPVWNVQLQKHPWCLPFLLRCQPTCTCSTWRNQTQIYEIKYTQCGYSVSTHYWLFLCTCCDHQSTNASPMRTPHIPDIWLETCGRYYLCEIGFLTVAGCLCLARFQWKLNLWKV